mgnify:CR=1 FL=1
MAKGIVSSGPPDVTSYVDDLEGRLTTTRAGYLDNLSGGAVALASAWTAALATALGSYTAALATLLTTDAAATAVGKAQIKATTISLNQAAATYDLFTGTTQVVILDGLSIKMPTGAAGGALTSISIQTDDVTSGVIISSTSGVVANLTSEGELSWTGFLRIAVGTKIRLTIAGGAHGSAYVADVVASCRAVVAGGYLA